MNDSSGSGDSGAVQRPSLSTVVADYDEMLSEMRDAMSSAVPGGTWSEKTAAQTLVGDTAVAGDDAKVSISPRWSFDAPFPAAGEGREELIAELGRIGEAHGFSPIGVFVDRDDEVQAVADDEYGAEYRVGGVVNSTVTYTTGSHPEQ
ncbi:LppA family lipoprotein [Herbiconiux sp. P15]|uniref:LppA family lipoprotein n=1 Tax=Herbiconiux liukaitaii TaxID=3342799 RepID=UPI0035B99999